MPMCTVENNDYTERMLYNYYTHCTCTIIRLHVYSSIGYARMYPCTHHTSVKCLSNITRSALLRRLIHNLFDLCTLDYCNAHKNSVHTLHIGQCSLLYSMCTGVEADRAARRPISSPDQVRRSSEGRSLERWAGQPRHVGRLHCRPTTQGWI